MQVGSFQLVSHRVVSLQRAGMARGMHVRKYTSPARARALRLVYLEIIPHNAAAGLEEIYRRNVPRNKCTSVKNVKV